MSAGRTQQSSDPIFGVNLGALRDVKPSEVAIRFAFGAGIACVAGVITIAFGSRVGGILLAFPAILPATLTLIEEEESERAAKDDDVGAVLGATALVPFAVTAWLLLRSVPVPAALGAATAAWLVTAIGLYLAIRPFRSR